MKNSSDQSEWPYQVYYRWTLLPLLAFVLSLTAGLGMIVLFPILLTIGHYLTLRACAAVVRPGLWFITLPFTYMIWIWSITSYLHHPGFTNKQLYFIAAYYGVQLLNALLIPFMTEKYPSSTGFSGNTAGTDLMMRWMLATVVAASTWALLYSLSTALFDRLVVPDQRSAREFSQGLTVLIISLIANATSGLALKGLEHDG